MRGVVWDGERLSTDEAKGAWKSPYDVHAGVGRDSPRRGVARLGHDADADGLRG